MIHFYSRKFYESPIKEVVEECLASLNRRAGLAGEAAPKCIDVIAKVTTECWDGETEEFRQDYELAMEREYQQALKGWEASLSDTPTRTAEEIAVTFTNAAFYLQPLIDAIQQRFGMCATVLLAGPIGEQDGKIGRYSSGSTTVGINIGVQICERQRGAKHLCMRGREGRGAVYPQKASGWHTDDIHIGEGSANVEGGGGGEREEGDEREERDAQSEGGERENSGDGARGVVGPYDELWQRDDRANWTSELARTHAAFATGRGWGAEWGGCVQKFFDFEAAWGYDEGLWKTATKVRPWQVMGWLNRGRKWTLPPALGGLLGSREATGQAEELWVGLFWMWWRCEVSERAMHRSSPHGPFEPSTQVTGRARTYATDLPKRDSTLPEAASERDQRSPHHLHRLPRHLTSLLYHRHLDTTVPHDPGLSTPSHKHDISNNPALPIPHRLRSSSLGVHQQDTTAPLSSTFPFADTLSHRMDLPRA
ncbi:hypothetical protein B0H14DRAFT_3481579 [Mycena olivaceomarginata]|nr:hypothetical protein B0H14DRAFT_3481579 [Mycena olivaceomarginata]